MRREPCDRLTARERRQRPTDRRAADALVLTQIECSGIGTLALSCGNGTMRELRPASETIHAAINGGTITGLAAENDNVLVSGTWGPGRGPRRRELLHADAAVTKIPEAGRTGRLARVRCFATLCQ
jgi:hypothetical protein